MADNLDTSGFLKLSVTEMAEQLGSKEEIVKNCLDIMKELEPVGVCAYDVKECLLMRLSLIRRPENAGFRGIFCRMCSMRTGISMIMISGHRTRS